MVELRVHRIDCFCPKKDPPASQSEGFILCSLFIPFPGSAANGKLFLNRLIVGCSAPNLRCNLSLSDRPECVKHATHPTTLLSVFISPFRRGGQAAFQTSKATASSRKPPPPRPFCPVKDKNSIREIIKKSRDVFLMLIVRR